MHNWQNSDIVLNIAMAKNHYNNILQVITSTVEGANIR